MTGGRAEGGAPLTPPPGESPIIVLVRPQMARNIGSTARAMANGGLFQLRIVAPRDGWPQPDALRAQKLTFVKHHWAEYKEQDFYDEAGSEQAKTDKLVQALAELFLQHGGLFLSGPAGVGKTFLMHALLKKLREFCPKDKQIISALSHCAAMLVGGKTLMHYLSKYKAAGGAPKRDSITIADECSEIQLHMWMELAQWMQMGVRFIILGDFKGQLKPIFD